MTERHLDVLLEVASATKGADGWWTLPEGRHLTLHVSADGASLTLSRVEALRLSGDLAIVRTSKGEIFVAALAGIFAGGADVESKASRKAGFV